jgi:cobalamin-dependent methionine synthase I
VLRANGGREGQDDRDGRDGRSVLIDGRNLAPQVSEVFRYLGHPEGSAPPPFLAERVRLKIEATRGTLEPRGVYAVYDVRQVESSFLVVEGPAGPPEGSAGTGWGDPRPESETRIEGAIGEFLGGSTRVAVFVVTAGREISRLCEEALHSGDGLGGLVLNAIGSHVAELVLDRLTAELRSTMVEDETLSLPYSPGYCGMNLREQRKVFSLVDAGTIGVELLETMIMRPLKSISGLIGIGPRSVVDDTGTPCERCGLVDCTMRRTGRSMH